MIYLLHRYKILTLKCKRLDRGYKNGFSIVTSDSICPFESNLATLSATHAEKDGMQQVLVNGLFRTFLLFRRRLRQRWRMTSVTSHRRVDKWRNPPRVLGNPPLSRKYIHPCNLLQIVSECIGYINYVGGKYWNTRWCDEKREF